MPQQPPSQPEPDPLLTISEVADRIGVCERTVRRWIARRELGAWRRGRIVRVPAAELRRFLER